MRRRKALQTSVQQEVVESKILMLRGHKVILSQHLAILYGVPTKVLIQAVKRNIERFPDDFMFQLTWQEAQLLRSQIVTLKKKQKEAISQRGQHIKYLPYAFTEQGVAMLSSVLNSQRAIQVNIEIMRAFVRLRRVLAEHADLARKLSALEKKYDGQFRIVFEAIRQLMTPPEPKRRPIGFHVK